MTWRDRLWCLVGQHEPLLTQRRTETGGFLTRPHTLVWVCRHCQRTLGETVIAFTPPTTGSSLKVERLRRIVRHANRSVR
jgi:hypothetical protein